MQNLKKRNRTAFTVVELVIVIAVIAILAGVLIPTFGGIIKQANISADTQMAAQISTTLNMDLDGTKDAAELYKAVADTFGEDVANDFAPKSAKHGYHFWYDISNNRVVLAQYSELAELASPVATPTAYANGSYSTGVADRIYLAESEEDEPLFEEGSLRTFDVTDDEKGDFYFMDKGGEIGEIIKDVEEGDTTKIASLNSIESSDPNYELAQFLANRFGAVAKVDSFAIVASGTGIEDLTDYVYIPYDAKTFTLTATGFVDENGVTLANKTVTWSVPEGSPITVGADGVVTIDDLPEIGVQMAVTVTATVDDDGKTETKEVRIVRIDSAGLDTEILSGITLYDVSKLGENIPTYTLNYQGAEGKTVYSIGAITPHLNWSESNVACNATVSITTDGNNAFSIDREKLTLTGAAGTQKVTVTIGNISADGSDAHYITSEFYVCVIDNSASAFAVKSISENNAIGQKYLFRVGNKNEFALDKLFYNVKPAQNVVLEIYDVTSSESGNNMIGVDGSFKAAVSEGEQHTYIDNNIPITCWKLDKDTWADATIRFTGTGVAKIRIGNKSGDTYTGFEDVLVEVVDGTNITAYSELGSSGNYVLLNDITMSSGSSYYLSGGTLFGNGFTFDVKAGAIAGTGYVTSNYLIGLNNANLDNVKVVGAVYTEINITSDKDYNRATVMLDGDSGIYNSYISNCMSPVRVVGNNAVIESTTLKGGAFANLDIRGGSTILRGGTTINQVEDNDKASDGSTVIGLGIVVWYDGTPDETKLIIDGELTQYNYVSKKQAEENIPEFKISGIDLTQIFLNKVFTDSELSGCRYNDGSNIWINTGILSMIDKFNASDILDASGEIYTPGNYVGNSITVSGIGYSYTAYVCTMNTGKVTNDIQAGLDKSAPDWVPTKQNAIAPAYAFDYTSKNYVGKTDGSNDYCYRDTASGTVLISMDEGETFNWDTSILTATKNGNTLSYTVSMNGTDYTGKSIAFKTSGDYTVIYTYTDSNNYDKDGKPYDVTYTQQVKISVSVIEATSKNAEFAFGASGKYDSTTVTIGNDTYVMPDVSATNSEIGSITVSGQTVYCPIINCAASNGKTSQTSGTTWYMLFPVFKNVVTITDYADGGTGAAITYNASTTSLPAGLAAVNPATTFQYASANEAPTTTSVYSNVLYYTSPAMEGVNRDSYTIDAKYIYKDNAGATYHYYVRYITPKITNTGCVTPDTLVTLADGTQKEIQYVTYEDQLLVWNHYTGSYDAVPAAIIFDHGYDNNTVIKLNFSDGTQVKVVNLHQFLDTDLNEYVTIDASTVAEYVGHSFAKQAGNGYATVTLESYEISEEYIKAYGIISALHYNILVEGMFSTDFMPEDYDLFNYFSVGDGLVYDAEQMQNDIEEYGLYTYEDFADYLTYEQFVGFNVQYFKVAVGRGVYTYEGILSLIDKYLNV